MTESTSPVSITELNKPLESSFHNNPIQPEKEVTDATFEINLDDDPRTVLESLAKTSPTEVTDLDESQYVIETADEATTPEQDVINTEQSEHPQTSSSEQAPITFDQAQQKVVDEAINRLRIINIDRAQNNQPPLSDYEVMWGINDALGKFQQAYQERFNDSSASVTTITELTDDIRSKMNKPTERSANESYSQPDSRDTSHSNSRQENYSREEFSPKSTYESKDIRENINGRNSLQEMLHLFYDNIIPSSGEYAQQVTETYIPHERKVSEKPMTILDILVLKMNKRLQKMNERIKHYRDRLNTFLSNVNRPPENPPTPA